MSSTADTQAQQQAQAPAAAQPLSQLWPAGFGASAAAAAANDFPAADGATLNGRSRNSGGFQSVSSNSTGNNNNYVNFNQFIMQHNLLNGSGTSGGGGTLAPSLGYVVGAAAAAANDTSPMTNGMGDNFYNFTTQVAKQEAATNAFDNFQTSINYFNPNSNLFPYNNIDLQQLSSYANGLSNSNTTPDYNTNAATLPTATNNTTTTTSDSYHNNYYDNLYSPFGYGDAGGTTYFANPFATGFDFSASNLQATAPEFVPRFGKLTLSEKQQQNGHSSPNNVGDGAAIKGQHSEPHNAAQSNVATLNMNSEMDGNNTSQFAAVQDHMPMPSAVPSLQSNAKASSSSTQLSANGAANLSNDNSSSSSSASPSATSLTRATGATSRLTLRADSRLVNGLNNTYQHNGGGSSQQSSEPKSKLSNASAARGAERERERDNRRFQNGRRSVDFPERGDELRERERGERSERGERGAHAHHRNNRERDYHQRYENHRSNKRRDDWNRNRDRINGFRDTLADVAGKESPLPSPEKKSSPKKVYPENEKLSQREKLIRDIETRRLECLVCVEPIKVHHSAWSCLNCYHILHLQCIIKWASSSKSDDGWRCPACQNVVKEVPRDYYCFCGKLKNPPYNRQDIAHSCGEVCGRIEGCPHACTLLCHPGPCPPCQANVKRECGCGKTTKMMQCCLKEAIACESTCDKLLNCDVHSCTATCHDGKCEPCGEKVSQTCHCSKQERQVACTRDSHDKLTYSCGKPCGKDLSCGNHKCKDCCHAGECRPCKQSPEMVTSCPCGKQPVLPSKRSSCLDAIPMCEGVCGKTLRCGKAAHPHHCTSKCHLGNCPPCNKQTAVKCRCGHMDQLIKCRQLSTRADDARCKKRCVKKRSCGKHKCNQECCIDIDHICPLPCNYTLSCGKHKCDQPCHRGNCPPCYRSSFEELYCECGAEVIYPPVPCGTKRPACKRPCSRTHPCEHAPQHNCHSGPSCPPCMMFTTKWCYGQHEQRKTIPCSQDSFSCGLACQKPLPCGRHKCIKTCHDGICQTPGEVCKQSCTALRVSCGHKCMAACHDGDCPETPCKEMVEVQCDCGNRKQMRACYDLAREYSRIATAQLASSMAEMQRGNYMELSEILAPVKMNKTNKTLDCNEECRLLDRNRRLAIGLQIRNPDLPQKLLTKYSDFIRNFAKRDPALVKSVHDSLTTLVKLAKESRQKSRSHSFPTMNREKRQLVHEMCEMFGVESVAYDAEPNRNVVATAYRDRSWLPATSIIDVMQRESGQRRVPVPSNNAWGIKR